MLLGMPLQAQALPLLDTASLAGAQSSRGNLQRALPFGEAYGGPQ